jgi:hypothetical protein
MSEGIVSELKLGEKTFQIWFFTEPDFAILTQPINGPEHNCKLAQLLRLLKNKKPESVTTENGDYSDDRQYARRLWLEELHKIEIGLAGELREQLTADAGLYIGHVISACDLSQA